MKQWILLLIVGVIGCRSENIEDKLRLKVSSYYEAKNNHDFLSPEYTEFKRYLSRTWHGEKKGEGIESKFNPESGWNEWDIAWNGSYEFEFLAVDPKNLIVKIRFKEANDFLSQVGIPEGLSATVTFWFDEWYNVKETQYQWDRDNQSVSENLEPIVEWAMEYDSTAIKILYVDDGFKANKEKAKGWKPLLEAYHLNN